MSTRFALGAIALCLAWQAAAADLETRPAAQCGALPCLNGGIGADEQETMRAASKEYNLQLTLASRGSGEYVADAAVSVRERGGKAVLEIDPAGPLFYARLAPGSYQVQVTVRGKTQNQNVTLPSKGTRALVFYWDPEP